MPVPAVVAPNVVIYSFADGNTIQKGCRWSVNLNSIRDPFGQNNLRSLNGKSEKVLRWIESDPRIGMLAQAMAVVVQDQLYAPGATDKHISFGLHDRRGTHISPAVARLVGDKLRKRFPHLPILLVHQSIRTNNHPTVEKIEGLVEEEES